MRKSRKNKFIFSWMKIALTVIFIIGLTILIYIAVTYGSIQKSKNVGFNATEKHVLEVTDLVQINAIDRFQELDEYHIVSGKTADDIEQMIFVSKTDPNEEVTIINLADIISKEEIEKKWASHCKKCKLVAIKPAMLNQTPLWELTYYDESNRYVFEYVSLNDGSEFEKVRLQRKFK